MKKEPWDSAVADEKPPVITSGETFKGALFIVGKKKSPCFEWSALIWGNEIIQI